MMDKSFWRERLSQLPLGDIHIYDEVSSTNTIAWELAQSGAKPFSLVLSDSQTAGKGRLDRSWVTKAGKALAISWILYPETGRVQPETLGLVNGLGPVGLATGLREIYDLPAEIKWPNDVLIHGKKAAGVLVDVHWDGCDVECVVLGMGVNVKEGSVPPSADLRYPAISLEDAAEQEINRLDLLMGIMESLLKWYKRLAEPSLINTWNSLLAFQGQKVALTSDRGQNEVGELIGVSDDGSLVLRGMGGDEKEYYSGEIQLRLVDRSEK
jgi:BirA family biotin operon repressor/biotin-[acetyl-CoA-carboxylase] ligase